MGERPTPRAYEIARLMLSASPRGNFYTSDVQVTCEPCLAGNHRLCTRPCVCRVRA